MAPCELHCYTASNEKLGMIMNNKQKRLMERRGCVLF